jgi:hypothetical protein
MSIYLNNCLIKNGKDACILTSLILFNFNALADWDFLTVNRDRTVNIWIESSSIQRREDSIFVWIIYDREEPAQDGAMSSKLLNQYDCTNGRCGPGGKATT